MIEFLLWFVAYCVMGAVMMFIAARSIKTGYDDSMMIGAIWPVTLPFACVFLMICTFHKLLLLTEENIKQLIAKMKGTKEK